jgi:hypothetical protein
MAYKVIPFKADIAFGEGSNKAAAQLEDLVNIQGSDGWIFQGLEGLETTITKPGKPGIPGKPGTNGCMGLGAVPPVPSVPPLPEVRNNARVYVAVFRRPDA